MNFSDQWRSLWPVAAVPHAPNLLSGDQDATVRTLIFHPTPQRHLLLASSSLAFPIPPLFSASILYGIQSFFTCSTNESFLPIADQYNLAADIQSSLVSAASNSIDPLSRNNLHALPCHDGFSLLLFFPTGDNADEIGFLCLHFGDDYLKPEVVVDFGGDVFKQREGMKHPRHQILKLSVISSVEDCSSPSDDSVIEGFLLATTMYSVNWFRVETQSTDEGKMRPLLIPLARQGFLSCVVDACWSPHFLEESAVLLESGELCWFNLVSKKGGTHKILVDDKVDYGRWLGCKFGGQPWVILVASSVAVVLIDLRPKKIGEAPKVLARVRLPDFLGVISMEEEKDDFQAFCAASYSDFHFVTLTKKLVLLFDIRQPLVPLLTCDHGLEHPTYVSMLRLSELRPSKEFKSVIESSFVILAGSFWKNDFRLFCYGSNDKGAFGSSFFAWGLPSSLSLSGKEWSSSDDLLRELILMEKHTNQEMLLRNNGVVGFCMVPPNNLLKCISETDGFILIRLMLSGKLEIQKYHSDRGSQNEDSIWKEVDFEEVEDFTIVNNHGASKLSRRFPFFKLCFLSNYLNQSQSNMSTETLELNDKGGGDKINSSDERFMENPEFFDVSSVKLDFEPFDVVLQPTELSFLKSLNRQASKWLENYKS